MSGYGYGYGYGDGSGYGYGYGYGYGSGSGYGDEVTGTIGDHGIHVISAWRLVLVGCEAHTLDYWRMHWQRIASEHDVEIDAVAVTDLLTRAEQCE